MFAGHFPGLPIVPGIYLIEAGRSLAERLHDRQLQIARIPRARFTAEVHPDVAVDLAVTTRVDGADHICDAMFAIAERNAAKIRLVLRGQP